MAFPRPKLRDQFVLSFTILAAGCLLLAPRQWVSAGFLIVVGAALSARVEVLRRRAERAAEPVKPAKPATAKEA